MKSRDRIVILGIAAVLGFAQTAQGVERLLDDLVELEDRRFVYDSLAICHLNLASGPSNKFQIRSRAEAPSEGVLSRDNFVALVIQTEQILVLGMTQKAIGLGSPTQALNALKCEPLRAAIGTVDLELGITMTSEGIQIEVNATGTQKLSRWTRTWEEMYE